MEIVDQIHRSVKVDLPFGSERIISTVPSQTELLFDLGLGERIVGVTNYCVHPKSEISSKQKIGGTKSLDLEKIISLKPHLIIANKEENEKEQIDKLSNYFPVWISDIKTLEDALEMIISLGKITNTELRAEFIVDKIQQKFQSISSPSQSCDVLYLIWRKPWMAAGRDTFINDMLNRCGLKNVCKPDSRYPVLSNEDVINLNPSLILLSSEPYPFKERHINELNELIPNANILLVDGEMFSWYGSRLLKSPDYFNCLIGGILKPRV